MQSSIRPVYPKNLTYTVGMENYKISAEIEDILYGSMCMYLTAIESAGHSDSSIADNSEDFAENKFDVAEYDQSSFSSSVEYVKAWDKRRNSTPSLDEIDRYHDLEDNYLPPKLQAKVDRSSRRIRKAIEGERWRVEYIRLVFLFSQFIQNCGEETIAAGRDFFKRLYQPNGMRSEFEKYCKAYKQKQRVLNLQKSIATGRDKERKQIIGMVIDELLRRRNISLNKAIRTALNRWLKQPRIVRMLKEDKYGKKKDLHNLKRRYFPKGIKKESVLAAFIKQISGKNPQQDFLSLRSELSKDFGNMPVTSKPAEMLYDLAAKKIKDCVPRPICKLNHRKSVCTWIRNSRRNFSQWRYLPVLLKTPLCKKERIYPYRRKGDFRKFSSHL